MMLAICLQPGFSGYLCLRLDLHLRFCSAPLNSYYEDHCLVNTIIAETIDQVQDEGIEKYSPGMD